MRAIQWIPTCQGLDGFQKYVRPCSLDECSLRIGRANIFTGLIGQVAPKFDQDSPRNTLWCSHLRFNCAHLKVQTKEFLPVVTSGIGNFSKSTFCAGDRQYF